MLFRSTIFHSARIIFNKRAVIIHFEGVIIECRDVETDNEGVYFLDLPAFADALGAWLDEREASGTWRPNVIRFSVNLLADIRPRAMTRDIDWGIPVPGWEDQPTKRLYVWFDAVIGYLSASIEWARRTGDPQEIGRAHV